jgi:hypothetical protein
MISRQIPGDAFLEQGGRLANAWMSRRRAGIGPGFYGSFPEKPPYILFSRMDALKIGRSARQKIRQRLDFAVPLAII